MTGLLVVAVLVLAAPQTNDPELARRLFDQAFDRHAELDNDSSHVLIHAARDADLSSLPLHLKYISSTISRLPNGLRSLRSEYAALPDSPLIRCLRVYVAVSPENLSAAVPTLMGMDETGEGLMGLTRAFLASGARAVVATQWPIGASAALLMGELHTRLAAGDSPATALRAAQIHLRLDPATSHPFYWAGFVIHQRT